MMFQTMEAVKQHRRDYRCLKCSKIEWNGRLVGHFYKYHVPFGAGALELQTVQLSMPSKQHLLDHITQYAPYVKEVKARGATDLRK